MDPISFFSNEEQSKRICKELAKDHKQALSFEEVSVSCFSPGIIEHDEFIARQIHSPIHFDEDKGDFTVAAFDDVFNKGMSTNRLRFESDQEVHNIGKAKAETDRGRRPDRQYMGFVKALVGKIRADFEGELRTFGVYDTSTENSQSHADLCGLILSGSSGLPKNAARLQRRHRLKKIFDTFMKS